MNAADNPRKKTTLETLQAGRGIAALLVVLFHLNGSIFGKEKYFPEKFWQGFSFGHAGVEYFFVLSGFIICYVHWKDIGIPARVSSFLRKRFMRIYPIYWVVLCLILLPAYLHLPAVGGVHEPDFMHILADVTLLPATFGTLLIVAWTLKHEVLFYAVFAVMIYRRRLGYLLAAVGLLGSGVCLLAGGVPYDPVGSGAEVPLMPMLFSPLHFLFLFGAVCAWFVRTKTVPYPALLATLGVGIFLATGFYESYVLDSQWTVLTSELYGLGSAIGIAGFIELERKGDIVVAKALGLLGDASYSLYLIHFPFLSLLAKLVFAAHLPAFVPAWILFAGMLAATIAAGISFHRFVEKPMLRRLKGNAGSVGAA